LKGLLYVIIYIVQDTVVHSLCGTLYEDIHTYDFNDPTARHGAG